MKENKYSNLTGILHSDLPKIKNYERLRFASNLPISEHYPITVDFYVIKLNYKDGTTKFIRVYCNSGTSKMLSGDMKDQFFFHRLFGEDGLIAKEHRNDYIYLGCIDNNHISRYIKVNQNLTMQTLFDIYIRDHIYPQLNLNEVLKNNLQEPLDPIDYDYYFHAGSENMNDIFNNGLINQHQSAIGFPSLTSTFFPTSNGYSEINNLKDSVRIYGKRFAAYGYNNVFILKIPIAYRNLDSYPMPTHRMFDINSKLFCVIPELIYGMYDITTGKLYKNPNYNPKYNPAGLLYDGEVADRTYDDYSRSRYDFMFSRLEKSYNELLMEDIKNGTFNELCRHYGISPISPQQAQKIIQNITYNQNNLRKK